MQNYKKVAIVLAIAVVSFLGGKYSGPSTVTTREIVKTDETKRIDTTRDIDKKETTLPDGTKIVETKSTTKRVTDTAKKSETSKVTITESRPAYRMGLIFMPRMAGIQDENTILEIQKRVASEFYIGIAVSTQKQIGVSLNVGF